MAFSLNVNGQTVEVDVPRRHAAALGPARPAGLTGTKYGCGIAAVRRLHGARRRQRDALLPLPVEARRDARS